MHRSRANKPGGGSNERLEFLGDSVLGLVVTEHLYQLFSNEDEGMLARVKSVVVSEDSLADIAVALHIDQFIIIGRGEEKSGGRKKKAILADALEAVIGACFLDAGFRQAKDFVLRHWVSKIDEVVANRDYEDSKSLLQEHLQKTQGIYPEYRLAKKTGPDHSKVFWMEVRVQDMVFGPCKGSSKKEAEKLVAELAYRQICNYEQKVGKGH